MLINSSLTDPNMSVHPLPPLPPDEVLCRVQVSICYAEFHEAAPHQMANPYGGLSLSVSGDLVTVANWIDEHVEAGYTALCGRSPFKQGEATRGIKYALLRGGVQVFGNVAFVVDRTLPAD